MRRGRLRQTTRTVCAVWLIVVAMSCSGDRIAGPADHGGAIVDEIPHESLLDIPTYDGSGQAVHPDVLYCQSGRLGHFFYMAMTPYPNGNSQFENPCILVSEDGVGFREEREGLNPLVHCPPYDHNCDPDLTFTEQTGMFYLYYLETMRPDSQNVVLIKSRDAINWGKERVIHYDLESGDDFIVSPAVLKVGSEYYMFFVNLSLAGHPIQFLISDDGIRWEKDSTYGISAAYPDGLIPWHIDVFAGKAQYLMLCCGPNDDLNLYLAASTDLRNWQFAEEPVLRHSMDLYDSVAIYRSSGIVAGDFLVIWFSLLDVRGQWRIGVKKVSLQALGVAQVSGPPCQVARQQRVDHSDVAL